MNAGGTPTTVHRGRVVLGVLMVVLAVLVLLEQAGAVVLQLRWLGPGLLVVAGTALLLSAAAGRRAAP